MRYVLFAFLSACAASEAASTPPTAQPQSGSPTNACVQVMDRARECTDQFLPALVDARARQDIPAGIAASVAQDRNAVIAEARTEWASDSTDDGIAKTCQRPVNDPDGGTASKCLAAASCDAYVACIIPIFEKHFAK